MPRTFSVIKTGVLSCRMCLSCVNCIMFDVQTVKIVDYEYILVQGKVRSYESQGLAIYIYTMNSTKLKVNTGTICNSKENTCKYKVFFCFRSQNLSVQTVQLIGWELVWKLHSGTWRLVIWKVPFSIKLIRPLFPRILWPSFSHWILGVGFPMMWQCNWVLEPGAKVWLAGPWRMIGGTRSEGAKGTKKKPQNNNLAFLIENQLIFNQKFRFLNVIY